MTHGAQQAIGLAGALLVERGETVVVEDPTYLGSIDIFAGQGARLVTVPVGGDAAWMTRLRETVARTAPRLAVPDADVPESDRRRDAGELPARARAGCRASSGCRSSRTTRSPILR